jgi:hypothetical protein
MTDTRGFYIPQMDAGNLMLLARRAGARFKPGERVLYRPAGTDMTTPATVRAVLAHITVRVAGKPGQRPDVSGGARVEYRLWLKGEHVSASESEVLPDETDTLEAC